jgi:hypothetical protein
MARIEPHKIEDFDQRVHFIEEKKENVGFDFRKLGRKLDQEEVSTFISRKYNVRVQKIRLVLLPVWDCLLSHKQSAAQRRLLLDACLAFRIEHKTHII